MLERRQLACVAATSPERIRASRRLERSRKRGADVRYLYTRSFDKPLWSSSVDGDGRPCTAPGVVPTNLGGKGRDATEFRHRPQPFVPSKKVVAGAARAPRHESKWHRTLGLAARIAARTPGG